MPKIGLLVVVFGKFLRNLCGLSNVVMGLRLVAPRVAIRLRGDASYLGDRAAQLVAADVMGLIGA